MPQMKHNLIYYDTLQCGDKLISFFFLNFCDFEFYQHHKLSNNQLENVQPTKIKYTLINFHYWLQKFTKNRKSSILYPNKTVLLDERTIIKSRVNLLIFISVKGYSHKSDEPT